MRWNPGNRSSNIEDRRGMSVGRGVGIGGSLIALVLSLIFGTDIFTPATESNGDVNPPANGAPVQASPQEEKLVDFVSFVLDSAQSTWARILPQQGVRYRDAKLVLFRDAVESACGYAETVTGPFYCPNDEKVYIDLGFFDELNRRFGAPGDFAEAYVLAHELGHHVQKVLGIEGQVRSAMERGGPSANALSVALELQADCFAGIFGHTAEQKMTTGRVSPESFTHGSSAQRSSWFKRGFASGRIQDCDTFAGR